MMNTPIVTRRAGLRDLDTLLGNVAAGFSSYAAFAPAGWEPPDPEAGREHTADLLGDPDTWALIAFVDGEFAGHASFVPGRDRGPGGAAGDWRSRSVVPGLAHLGQLFVLAPWWGRGVAPLLHDAAIGEMVSRGYVNARLFTPTDHAHARRFYERRGWIAGGAEWNEHLRLSLTEYRLSLGGPSVDAQAPGSQPSR